MKKIYRNPYFRLTLITLVIFGFSLYLRSTRTTVVEAFDNSIKIVPSGFRLEQDESQALKWIDVENIFSQDLNQESDTGKFSLRNSTYLVDAQSMEELRARQLETKNSSFSATIDDSNKEDSDLTSSSTASDTTDSNSDTTRGFDSDLQNINQKTDLPEIFINADKEIETPTGSNSAPDNTSNANMDAINTDTEMAPTPVDSDADNQGDQSLGSFIDLGKKTAIQIIKVATDIFIGAEANTDEDASNIEQASGSSSVEENYNNSEIISPEKSIESQKIAIRQDMIFTGFDMPGVSAEQEIGSAKIGLSLSALSESRNDQLLIEYRIGSAWVNLARIDLFAELSNQRNNGFFMYPINDLHAWRDLSNLELRISYLNDKYVPADNSRIQILVDALWMELEYGGTNSELMDAILNESDQEKDIAESDYEFELISGLVDFKTTENPEFKFKYGKKKGMLGSIWSSIYNFFGDEYRNIQITARIKELEGEQEFRFQPKIIYLSDGTFDIEVPELPNYFKPGKHTLEIIVTDGEDTYVVKQDFTWGVLAFNTNKSVYLPTETVNMQLGVLNDNGDTICDARIFIEVTAPDGGVAYLSSDNRLVTANSECGANNVIDTPDYNALYGLAGVGRYELKIIADTKNGLRETTDYFEVRDWVPFEIERVGPTRIYPKAQYRMIFRIKSNVDYRGNFTEYLPKDFLVFEKPGAILSGTDNGIELAWDVDWKAGEYYDLSYTFDAPDISPEFYLLGPARTKYFSELRQWQISSDALTVLFVKNTGSASVGAETNFTTLSGFSSGVDYIIFGGIGGVRYDAAGGYNNTYLSVDGSHLANLSELTYTPPRGGTQDDGNSKFAFGRRTWGSETYQLRFSGSAGDVEQGFLMGIATSSMGRAGTDYFYNTLVSTSDLPTSYGTTYASVTFTPDGTSTYLIIGQLEAAVDVTAQSIGMDIYNGSVSMVNNIRGATQNAAENYQLFAATTTRPTATSSMTFSIRGRASSATTGDHLSSRILIIRLNYYKDFSCGQFAGSSAIANAYGVVATTNLSLSVSGDVVVLYFGGFSVSTQASDVSMRARYDSTVQYAISTNDANNGIGTVNAWSTTDIHNTLWMDNFAVADTASHTYDVSFYRNVAGASARWGLVCAWSEAEAPPPVVQYKPTGNFVSVGQKTDGTGAVDISIEVDDQNDEECTAKIQYVAGADCNFLTPLDPTIDTADANTTADYGDPVVDNNWPYQIGTSTTKIITASGSNTVDFDWLSKSTSDVPNADGVYCVRLTVNDGTDDQETPVTATTTLDNVNPTNPGNLSATSSSNTVRLTFGATSTDTHFTEYKIFYKAGASGVTESDTPWTQSDDASLASSTFAGATSTLIENLDPYTQYVFRIWVYDSYGNKASSSQETTVTTGAAEPLRVNTVQFHSGYFFSDGTIGKNSDTNYDLGAFNFRLAEINADIKSAFIVFEAMFDAYAAAGPYTGYNLAFDACEEPCTANAWTGTSTVIKDDNTVLAYNNAHTNIGRLMLNVTSEAQMSAYTGNNVNMEGNVGYRIERGTAANSISFANAYLVITYVYKDSDAVSITRTVVYPLESNVSGDRGTRRSVQTDDCVPDTSGATACPRFTYTVTAPEAVSSLSNWFRTYGIASDNRTNDALVSVNIETYDVSSGVYYDENANGLGSQGESGFPTVDFPSVYGLAENSAQTLEYHPRCSAGAGNYYLLGAEVFDTYIASSSASVKTRTVSFPVGVISDTGTSKSNNSISVYFPENGSATGTVSIKKAWVRVNGSSGQGAFTITVSTQVGNNAESTGSIYSYTHDSYVIKPSFNVVHVIPSTDYPELESANKTTAKSVIVYTTNSSGAGASAELMITYTYTDESNGYLSSAKIFGGQTDVAGNAQSATTSNIRVYFPEITGDKYLRGAGLMTSYLMSDSDGGMPTAFTVDARLATTTPSCSNIYSVPADSMNEYAEFYRSVLGSISPINNQTYVACYSNNGGGDTSAGGKMNTMLTYTYQWNQPPSTFAQDKWRWYANNASTTPTVAKANEGVYTTNVYRADTLRLRVNLSVGTKYLATSSQAFKLQYSLSTNCASSSSWADVGAIGSTTAEWVGYDNGGVSDGATSSSPLLSNSNLFETYEEENNSISNPKSIAVGQRAEWDWVLYNNVASSSKQYCFRMALSDGTALDTYASTSYPYLTTAQANTAPANASNLIQYKADGVTVINNDSWINTNGMVLSARTTDVDINEIIMLYFQFIPSSTPFTTSTTVPVSPCPSGTAYGSCGSLVWMATSTSGDYRSSYYTGTTSIASIPSLSEGYKWQVLACDNDSACALWIKPGPVPNVKVDLDIPNPPGPLTIASVAATGVTLNFGSSTDEANFKEYKIFYKQAASGVSESDLPHTDSNLSNQYYNSATSTPVGSLAAGTPYVFNIWVYDWAGNKASSTEVATTTGSSFNTPTGSFDAATQKTDGSGGVDIRILVDDADNDNTLRVKIDYETGGGCGFASSSDPTLDEDPAKIWDFWDAFPNPVIDNNWEYQVGSSSAWIPTSPGANYVEFDWLSKLNVPNLHSAYCLRMIVYDGTSAPSAPAYRTVNVDNLAPTAPGSLTYYSKNSTSLRLTFHEQSTDSNAVHYVMYYSTSTPVTTTSTQHVDSNLSQANYNNATSTLITGLSPGILYYVNIWGVDYYGNKTPANEYSTTTNALPASVTTIGQFRSDGTTAITNGAWHTENQVMLSASTLDADIPELPTLYFQFIPVGSTFITTTTQPTGACTYGSTYDACGSNKIWYVAPGSPGDYSSTPYTGTTSITGITQSATGYKWQVLACDDSGDCASSWTIFNTSTPNMKIDSISPTPAGDLSQSSKTSNSITLLFGASSTEANFLYYKIYYATSSPVSTSSINHVDSNLNSQTYNSATITTVSGLLPETQYFFNIWAYDQAGHSTSSSEITITTNAIVSTPGVLFYTKNTRVLYYQVWDGANWSSETPGPTMGSGATDYIRHIRAVRSDNGAKIGILTKTWDGTNQEWWGTVYLVAADSFATSTQLGSAYGSATNDEEITGCIASLSGGEFFVVRDNNGSNGTQVFSWDGTVGWVTEAAGPDPVAVLNGCELLRRPGTDNYVLTTYDDDADVGTSYYYGGSTYANTWTTPKWTEHSTDEESINSFVGEGFFDPSDNTRGAFYYSDSASNWSAIAKRIIVSNNTIAYGAVSSTPVTWANDFVQGEFAVAPDSTGVGYFIGQDINNEINVLNLNVASSIPAWSEVTNGDNISGSGAVAYNTLGFAKKPYDIAFHKNGAGVVVWNSSGATSPQYRNLTVSSNSVSASNTAVPGATSTNYSRVRIFNDPNEDELLVVYQDTGVNYYTVFYDGASDRFYNNSDNPGSTQNWSTRATSSGAFSTNDECTSFAFTAGNSGPNTPTTLVQYKSDVSSTISNGAWINQNDLYFGASATDPDTSEVITLYIQFVTATSTFSATTTEPTGACVWGTTYSACTSTIWFVASSSPGDYSVTPFTDKAYIMDIPDDAGGYKWQVISCDDSASCSSWKAYNASTPNLKVDVTPPSAPGKLTVYTKDSDEVMLTLGSSTNETNFYRYVIYYKIGSSGVTEGDSVWGPTQDGNLGSKTYASATSTTITGLASSTQYVFNIWAYDLAGNKASSTPEVSTTTNAGEYLRQTNFIIENDDGATVNDNTAENAASTTLTNINIGQRLVVRLAMENTGGDTAYTKVYKIQYCNYTDDLCDAEGDWTDPGAATQISTALGLSGATATQLGGSTADPFNANTLKYGYWYEGVNVTGSYTLEKNKYTEFAFVLKTINALAGKTYWFRLYNNTNSRLLNSYTKYASISTIATETKRYSKGSYSSLPTTSGNLDYYFDAEGYVDVSANDDTNRDELSSTQYPVVLFVTKHTNSTDAVTATWNGQSDVSPLTKNVVLQVFRFGSTNAWVTVDTNSSTAASTDFSLTGNINSNLSEYYSSNWTYWRVYQQSGTEILKTDYFNASFSAPVPEVIQTHYRWRNDDGSQSTASWRESEDIGSPTVGASLDKNQTIRLRFAVANQGGGTSTAVAYKLEYATTTTTCANPGSWSVVTTNGSGDFTATTSSYYTNQATTTSQMTTGGYSFVTGYITQWPSNTSSAITLIEGKYTEVEYAMMATDNAMSGGTYCFRVSDDGSPLNDYVKLAEITLAGVSNDPPTFTTDPSDGGSATSSPTMYGSKVYFSATANDTDSSIYYLAICQGAGITPGNNAPPTCTQGGWCYSGETATGTSATCEYTTATSSEVLNWYAYACDKMPGVGVAKCSSVSQGSDPNDGSPFNVNHPPLFSSLSTSAPANKNPGSTFTIETVSSDTDTVGGADTLSLFVCTINSASVSGCSIATSTICENTGYAGTNISCDYVDTAPTLAGSVTYYAFIYDSHSLASVSNSRTSSYTINNTVPSVGTLTLNNGALITVNLKGEVGKIVTSTITVSDENSCIDESLLGATAVVYMSNPVVGEENCADDPNNCYLIDTDACIKSGCTGATDYDAIYNCTTSLAFYADPTDSSNGNDNDPYFWKSYINIFDGENYATSTSAGVELRTNESLSVLESLIDFGSNMNAGDDTGTVNSTSTVINYGNCPIDTRILGTDMTAGTSSITVNYIEWDLSNFAYSYGSDLSTSYTSTAINIAKPTSDVDVLDYIFWGLGLPFGTKSFTYYGSNTFQAIVCTSCW